MKRFRQLTGRMVMALVLVTLSYSGFWASRAHAQTFGWEQISASEAPPRPGHSAMAYDSARGVCVLFSGSFGNGYINSTWEWDGASWTQKAPTSSPSPRLGMAMAYDSARGRTVLFGGYGYNGVPSNETWEWDGTDWTQRASASSPPARFDAAMAYDSIRGRTVLFGGAASEARLNDLWEWDGTDWARRESAMSSPAPRSFHSLSFDSSRGRTVLFGGEVAASDPIYQPNIDDTWEWDGSNWAQVFPTTHPGVLSSYSMSFDSARSRTVLVGGTLRNPSGSGSFMSDVWEWDGAEWRLRKALYSLAPTTEAPMAYDARRDRMVLVRGFSNTETWELSALAPLTLDLNGDEEGSSASATWSEGGPVALAPRLQIRGAGTIPRGVTSATVSLPAESSSQARLSASTAGTFLLASYDPWQRTLYFRGSASVAQYQQVLASVTYDDPSRRPVAASLSATFRIYESSTDQSADAASTLQIVPVDNPPTAAAQNWTGTEDIALPIRLVGADPDGAAITWRIVRGPQHGALTGAGPSLLYTPSPNFSGADSFAVVANDGALDSAPAEITVQMREVNDRPVARVDFYTSTPSGLQVLAARGVLANDTDIEGDALSARLLSGPRSGLVILEADGSFSYLPRVGFSGHDSFTYALSDSRGGTSSATVALNVPRPAPSTTDRTPPGLYLSGAGTSILTNRLLPLRVLCSDASGLRSLDIRLQRTDGQYWNGRAFTKEPYSLPTSGLDRQWLQSIVAGALPTGTSAPQGRYNWSVVAVDKAGNASRASRVVVLDTLAPTLSIETPRTMGGVIRVTALSAVSGRSPDARSVSVTLRRPDGLFWDGRAWKVAGTARLPEMAADVRGGQWALPPSLLPQSLSPGTYTLSANATDAAGNTAAVRCLVAVTSTSSA